MTKEEGLRSSIPIHNTPATRELGFETSGYMQVSSCSGSHRYFVAETFAVEGEGTVGAIVICTACGESKVIIHKVASHSSSISLKEK